MTGVVSVMERQGQIEGDEGTEAPGSQGRWEAENEGDGGAYEDPPKLRLESPEDQVWA